jgi:hypothetical protein
MTKIFNPLHSIPDIAIPKISESESKSNLQSTSSLYNETVGVCPKCGNKMKVTKAEGNDVFFCPKDRVVLPLPDSQI